MLIFVEYRILGFLSIFYDHVYRKCTSLFSYIIKYVYFIYSDMGYRRITITCLLENQHNKILNMYLKQQQKIIITIVSRLLEKIIPHKTTFRGHIIKLIF